MIFNFSKKAPPAAKPLLSKAEEEQILFQQKKDLENIRLPPPKALSRDRVVGTTSFLNRTIRDQFRSYKQEKKRGFIKGMALGGSGVAVGIGALFTLDAIIAAGLLTASVLPVAYALRQKNLLKNKEPEVVTKAKQLRVQFKRAYRILKVKEKRQRRKLNK